MYKLVAGSIIFQTAFSNKCVTFNPNNDMTVYRRLWEYSNINCTVKYMTFDAIQVISEFDHDGTATCIQGRKIGINLHTNPCINYNSYDEIHGTGSFINATRELNHEMIFINKRKLTSYNASNENNYNCTNFEADRGCMSRGFCNTNGICDCNNGYTTYQCDNNLQCCHSQKKQWVAFLIAWVGSWAGGPWWYAGISGIAGGILGGCVGLCCCTVAFGVNEKEGAQGACTMLFSLYIFCVTLSGVIITGTNKLEEKDKIPMESWRRLNEDTYHLKQDKINEIYIDQPQVMTVIYCIGSFIFMFILMAMWNKRGRRE